MVKNILLVLLLTPFLLFNAVIADEEFNDNQLPISKIIIQGNAASAQDAAALALSVTNIRCWVPVYEEGDAAHRHGVASRYRVRRAKTRQDPKSKPSMTMRTHSSHNTHLT